MDVPEYRVRLFLSVDLTGSTAYKNKNKNTLDWIKAFQRFYGQFPQILGRKYSEICDGRTHIHEYERSNGSPKLWKTVGDEILFCCRLTSLCHLSACVDAFVEALKEFGTIARAFDLNTKGNAWVASFPTPNCSIMPVQPDATIGQDSLNGIGDLPSEENEAKVDAEPSSFDFLGKGIDAGFRISKNSAIDTLTVSPGLGILLTQAARTTRVTKFSKAIRFTEMQVFKGVADSNPYPVLTIDTYRDTRHESLIGQQRKLLGEPDAIVLERLEKYLNDYLEFYEIEIPKVKDTYSEGAFTPPDFYLKYCDSWQLAVSGIKVEDQNLLESSNQSGEEVVGSDVSVANLDNVVDEISSGLD